MLWNSILVFLVHFSSYKRNCLQILPIDKRELILSATFVVGVLVADSMGIQNCVYEVNGLKGALISYPL
jgi:hypothetical protein